jgi:hypothetical protein
MNAVVILLHFVLAGTLLFLFWKREPSKTIRQFATIGILLKLGCGIALGAIYRYYYETGDTLLYFEDGKMLAQLARNDISVYLNFLWSDGLPGTYVLSYSEPRALFFVKFVSIVNLVTSDNYWLTSCWFSLISFFGAWALWHRLAKFFPEQKTIAFVAFCVFPSVVFWSSGLIKESIAMPALFYLSALFLDVWFKQRITIFQLLGGFIGLWMLWGLKYYYAAVFLPVVFTCIVYRYILSRWMRSAKTMYEALLWLGVFTLLMLVVSFTHPNFYPQRFMEVIVSNHDIYRQYSAPGDMIDFGTLEPDAGSLLLKAPLALLSGLFRPHIFEAGNVFQWAAAIENFFLFVIFIAALRNLRTGFRSKHTILLLAAIVYISVLCVFLTLSTPNFGTLSRYRVGYLPYFVFIILCHNPVMGWIQTLRWRFGK